MLSYNQEHIKLREAMTVPFENGIRVWEVSGIYLDVNKLPENATDEKTFVMMFTDKSFALGISLNIEGDLWIFSNLDLYTEISTLEELQETYPKLFELDGRLYTLAQ